jgi:DNA-binding transcriptional ArsR family regulator
VSPKRFVRAESRNGEVLERDILNALGGGQTRSAVELVTDLAVQYADLSNAMKRLLDNHLVLVEYEAGDESYFRLTPRGVDALGEGGALELGPPKGDKEVAPPEPATRR